MKKSQLKKLLSLMLSVVLILSVCIVAPMSASSAEPGELYTGFEDAVMCHNGGANSSTAATISAEQAKAGAKSLRFELGGTARYSSFMYADGSTPLKLEPNTDYVGSFWYYAEKSSSGVTIYIDCANSTVWDGRTELDNAAWAPKANIGVWTEVEVEFNSGECASKPNLVFSLVGNSGDIYYLDEFKIKEKATGITLNNCGDISVVQLQAGQTLPNPTAPEGMNFVGWYEDVACTTEFGTVKENDTRTAYAKYDKTLITFEQKTDYVAGTDFRDDHNPVGSGVVVDPTDPTNHVFKLHSPDTWSNLQLPIYEAADAGYYKLESGHSYTFSLKFMIPDTIPTAKFTIRWNKGQQPTDGAGRTPFGAKEYTTADITPGKWYTHTTTYNVGDTSTQYGIQAVFLVVNTNYDTNYVYFDDITITDNDAEYEIVVPNASTDTYTSFEDATVTYNGGFNSSTAATISTTQAKTGTKSLKIAPGGSARYRSYVYNGTGSAIRLSSYTVYEGSYWYYAESASTNKIYLERVDAGSVWSGNIDANVYTVDTSITGQWVKVDFKFNSGDCSRYSYLIFGLESNSGDVFYFDEFTITATGKDLTDFNCEFDADFSFYDDWTTNSPYYCSIVDWSQNDGVVTFPTSHSGVPSASGSSVHYFSPYDGSKFFAVESNSVYEVKLRYKQTAANASATGRLSIGVKKGVTGWAAVSSLAIENHVGTTDWIEKTYNITTGDLGDQTHLVITMGSSSGQIDYELDYIKVTKGPFLNDSGEISKLNTAAGSEIPEPAAKDGLQFLGWFSDINCTVPYGKVQTNETRNAYAKYDKTLITFGQAQFTSGGNYRDDASKYSFTSGIITDPNDAVNNVFKHHNPGIWANTVVPSYDAVGALPYTLQDGNEYTFTLKYMVPETVTATYISFRLYGGTTPSAGKHIYNNTSKQINIADIKKGEWQTYTTTFTATNTASYPNLMYSFLMDDNSNTGDDVANPATFGAENFLYIDDVIVYNASSLIEITTNDRGYISTETIIVGQELAPLRSVDEANFLGWYADPECTVPFGAIQANDTRTAYAKYDTVKIGFNANTAVPGLTQISNSYALKFDATSTATRFNIPCYDAANASNLTVEANKTYAVRFIYKLTAGSDAGYISVLDNKLNFKATETGTDGWAAGAITFTTTEAGELTFNVASDSTATVYVDEFLVYEIPADKPSTSVTAGSGTIDATAPTAKNNMLTGTVTVNPGANEQLAVKGLTISYDLYATAFSEKVTTKIITNSGAYDLDRDNVMGSANEFIYMVPAAAKNITISAEFVSSTEPNMAIIAGSIREKTETQRYGLRFRGRVYNDANITKVGFLLTPERLITAAGETELTLENAESCNALNIDATDIYYDMTDSFVDRQVLLTNIDKLLDTEIRCVMYVEYNDNSVKYSAPATQSYSSMSERTNKVYRGITSYYYEEFENTRDKLISKSEDGSFSAIMLTDTHVDYSLNTTSSSNAGINKFYTTQGTYYERPAIHRQVATIVELANTSDVDCIVLGGDMIHGTEGRANALADLQLLVDMCRKAKVPVYLNKGNHDNNDYHGTPCALRHLISTDTWTEELLKPLAKNTEVHDENNDNSAYYYVDFPEKKTRLIVLSPYSYPITSSDGIHCDTTAEQWNRVEDTQLKWFANIALDAEKQGWNYVISAHGPITGPETIGSAAAVMEIVNAFNNKTTVSVAGANVNFANAGSYIPYSISGHTHISSYRHVSESNHIAINTGSGRMANYPNSDLYNNVYGSTEYKYYNNGRYEGTHTEALFDVYVANSDASVIDRINFGPNCDNTFTLGDTGYSVAEID